MIDVKQLLIKVEGFLFFAMCQENGLGYKSLNQGKVLLSLEKKLKFNCATATKKKQTLAKTEWVCQKFGTEWKIPGCS